MIHYQVTMRHDEKTLELLAHKQYDLFCKSNQVVRTLISIAAMGVGIINLSAWWGVLLIVYGAYLTSSKYAQANHTAKKMVNGIKSAGLDFPASRYLFRDNAMEVITLPENTTLGEPLMYGNVLALGEDGDYFYLFRDRFGGYMIPKKELGKGEEPDEFRFFMEQKTGKTFQTQIAPVFKLLRKIDSMQRKKRKS